MQFKDLGNLFDGFGDIVFKGAKGATSFSDLSADNKSNLSNIFKINSSGISEFTMAQTQAKASAMGLTDALTNELMAMASDADFSTKAASGKLTWGQALNDNKISITDLGKALSESGNVSDVAKDALKRLGDAGETSSGKYENLVKNIVKGNGEFKDLSDTVVDVSEKVSESTSLFSKAGTMGKGILASFKQFASTGVGKLTIAATAISAAITAFKFLDDKFDITFDTAFKHTSEGVSKVQNLKSEIDSLNSQTEQYKQTLSDIASSNNIDISGLDSVDDIVNKINSVGGISLVDQTEVDKISTANASLERTLELKNMSLTSEQKETADKAKKTLKKQINSVAYDLDNTLRTKYEDNYVGMPEQRKYQSGDILKTVKSELEAVEDYKKTISDLQDKKLDAENVEGSDKNQSWFSKFKGFFVKKDSEKIQDQIDDYDNAMKKIQSDIDNKQTELSTLLSAFSVDGKGIEALPGYEKYFNLVNDMLSQVSSSGKSASQKALASLNTFFDGSVSKNAIKKQLVDAKKAGDDLTKSLKQMGLSLSDLGIDDVKYLSSYLKEAADSADNAKKSVEDYATSVSDVETATNSVNKDKDWSTIQSAYKAAKDLLTEGKTGTDDFQSMASFLNPKKVKEYAEQGGKYTADAYQKAFEEIKATADRWFGDDETTSMENFVNDFSNKGLWNVSTDAMGLWDIQKNFKSTAEAADKFGISVNAVETMLHGLEAYGYDFGDVMFSGKAITEYKSTLDNIKTIYDSMEDSAEKTRLGKLIENWDDEYQKYSDDLSTLTSDEPIVKIKFEYDLASVQQEIDKLDSQWSNGDHSASVGASRIALKEQKKNMLEQKSGYKDVGDEAYNSIYDKMDKLREKLASATDKDEITALQDEKSAYLDMLSAFNQFRLDGNDINWEDYLKTDDAANAFDEILKTGSLKREELEKLFGKDFEIPVKLNMSEDKKSVLKELDSLKSGESITYTAKVDGNSKADVTALKNEDGTIIYKANIDGAEKTLSTITDADGNISYTATFDGSQNWINNNLKEGYTLTFNADIDGVKKTIDAVKDQDGNVKYYATMDDGSKKEVQGLTNKDGKITFHSNISEADEGIRTVEEKAKESHPEISLGVSIDQDQIQNELDRLQEGKSFKYKGTVDGKSNSTITASKDQEGVITYTAKIGKVEKELDEVIHQDGTIDYTTNFDGADEKWLKNNLDVNEQINFTANVGDVKEQISAIKDEEGQIHYYVDLPDGSRQELKQYADENGVIRYEVDTSKANEGIEEAQTKAKNTPIQGTFELDTKDVMDKLSQLETGKTITFDANLGDAEAKITALRNEDGTITYTAITDGLQATVYPYIFQDGTIHYTADPNVDMSSIGSPTIQATAQATGQLDVSMLGVPILPVKPQLQSLGGTTDETVTANVSLGTIPQIPNQPATVDFGLGNYPKTTPSATSTVNFELGSYPTSLPPITQTVVANKVGFLHGTAHKDGTLGGLYPIPKLSGRALALGSLQDTSWLKDNWKTSTDNVALTGEVGRELVVNGNRWWTVGDNGAEFSAIPKGSVVFDANQTKELLSKGFTNSRAKGNAFLQGTAYRLGTPNNSGGSSGSSGSSSSNTNTSNTNSDTSSKAEETKETLDWIETELDRIKRNIDLVDKTASSTYKNWSKRNEALVSELSQVSNELNVQQQAYDRYIQQANSVGLSEDWASKVRDGRIDIETITDSDLKDKISDYKTWYEKALDCRDAIADLREQESKLYEQKFNNLKDEYDDILDQFDHTQKMLEGYIDLTEAQGYISSSKYYDALIENENEKLNNLTSKRNDLINSLDEALASGKIDKYSESWYDMQQEINSVDEAILDCNKNTIEWGNNIRQIGWDIFDKLEDRISDITDEADFLVDLMSSEKMYDDKNGGTITDYGKATLGLHGVKYNTYMQQADEYRKEMEKLQEALNADPHNQDLLDRYDDLKDKQRDIIKNAKDEKDAIKDLVEDGINAELDALQKLIDKYTDLLDNNKDLYDYQKQLEEAQKNIASLEKQREAYRGDTSEEGQSKLQQIENDLADARQDLEETQYERSIADQKKLLDDLYNDYEEMLNLRLDNIDMLVQDVITNVNAESAGIRETLETVSSNVGYNMTESMNTIWSSANNVITTYGDKFSTQLTGVLQAINDLKNLLQQQVDAANKKAQTNTTAAKKPSTTTNNKPSTKPSTNTNTNQNTTQGNGKVEIGDAVKFLSGSYYYSSDGQTPTGDEMHGQTVYITHINTASWAKKQYHIARDKAGNRPLGWVDISQISGFKNGTDYVPYDQLATVAEDGAEGIVHADGRLEKVKALSESDAVINNKSFRNLLNFSANPVEVLRDAILGNQVIPKDFIDVSTPVAPVTNNVTANNTFNFDINVDKPNNYDEFYSEVMTRFQKDIKAEKVVQHMTFGQLNGKGKLEKYKPQF